MKGDLFADWVEIALAPVIPVEGHADKFAACLVGDELADDKGKCSSGREEHLLFRFYFLAHYYETYL